ncbi:Hypothetical predicted protein, partial [Pelobates cultripes]
CTPNFTSQRNPLNRCIRHELAHTEKLPPRPQALPNTDHANLRCHRVPPGIIHADCDAEIDTC